MLSYHIIIISFICSEQNNTAYDSDANYEQDQQG